ncbi:antitoxin VbhA family protein [Kribbella sp. NPDC048915]|uniref:antitoxin VbhA family protein n=1 Tax=Kribbella sp. NPDC048915 TaxID=3155148 RepID=UPI0033E14D12
MPPNRAVDRLDPEKRHQLDNLVASWRMENMPLTDTEIEIFARYLLGEITAEERRRLLDEQL